MAAVVEEARARDAAWSSCRRRGRRPGDRADKPWWASCDYLGDLRGRVAVNIDLPMSAVELLVLALHETYPGHHTERCCKGTCSWAAAGCSRTLVLGPTPQSVVSEGIAVLAPDVLERDGGGALAAVRATPASSSTSPTRSCVERALEPCRWAEVNAALMLHEHGAEEAEVRAYLDAGVWSVRSSRPILIRFLTEPTSRTYIVTYPAGGSSVGRTWRGTPRRFRSLLTEQVRVGDLRATRPCR